MNTIPVWQTAWELTKSHFTGYDIQRLSCDKVMYMYHWHNLLFLDYVYHLIFQWSMMFWKPALLLSKTVCFIKNLDNRQSPKHENYVRESYIIVRALQGLKYIYVTHVTKHTNMFQKKSIVGHCGGNMNHTTISGGEQYFSGIWCMATILKGLN
jgi:hypothetical protein